MSKIRRNLSTPESRAFWAHADRCVARVAAWPEWKKRTCGIKTKKEQSMTDRIHSLVVVLDREYRDDDVEEIVHAIQMIRGVAEVENGPVADMAFHAAKAQVHRELRTKIRAILWPQLAEL